MRRFMMHLLVAVIAFIVGVTAANLLGLLFGRSEPARRFRGVRVERRVTREAPPARAYDCPYSHPLGELPAPVTAPDALSEPPPPPPAPAAARHKVSTRIVIRNADGTTQVIETPPAAQVR
jgi:hypothetical protein